MQFAPPEHRGHVEGVELAEGPQETTLFLSCDRPKGLLKISRTTMLRSSYRSRSLGEFRTYCQTRYLAEIVTGGRQGGPPERCTLYSDPMEPWLRGTHTDLPAVLRAVVHALELAREDVDAACAPLSDAALDARPGNVASIAFHLRHIPRTLDRLLTYAEGNQLSPVQLEALKSEGDPGASKAALLAEFHAGLDAALPRIRAFAAADLAQPRAVGRKALPTTVAGLLVHCADHTQRHAGQLVTTARIVGRPEPAS